MKTTNNFKICVFDSVWGGRSGTDPKARLLSVYFSDYFKMTTVVVVALVDAVEAKQRYNGY